MAAIISATLRTVLYGVTVLCASLCAVWAAQVPISILGDPLPTQITIQYTATTDDDCAVSAVDNNGGPTVHDLDATLFPSANQSLARTADNGYRWPTFASGRTRTVTIGGHDQIKQGLDGRWYSLALQAGSDHTITVSCRGGADSGSIHVKTAPVPHGSSYPEMTLYDANAPHGGLPQPSVDWSNRREAIIDDKTGVLLQHVTSPADFFIGGGVNNASMSPYAVDVSGKAWNNPANASTNRIPSSLASTSTPNAPLFVPFPVVTPYCCGVSISDFRAHVYGKGNSGSEIASICISKDSGATCASGAVDVHMGTATGTQGDVPAGYPTAYFTGWGGGMNSTFGTGYDIAQSPIAGANAVGSTITIPVAGQGFNVDRAPGSKLFLSACASGTGGLFTVASVDTPFQLTVREGGLNATNCTYQDLAVGFRVWLKNSGTINVSLTFDDQWTESLYPGTNADSDICSPLKVNDIVKDCDGVVQSPPLSGRLCQMGNFGSNGGGLFLVQDNGRMCLQSQFSNGPQGNYVPVANPWSGTDPKTFAATDYSGDLLKGVLSNGGDYTEYVPGVMRPSDKVVWSNMSVTGVPLLQQAQSYGGVAAQTYATGLWGTAGLNAVMGGYTSFRSQPSGQDSPCLIFRTDMNQTLVQALTSFDKYPIRWGGCHFSPVGSGNYMYVYVNPDAHYSNAAPFGGPYMTQPLAIRRNGTFTPYMLPAITGASNSNPLVLSFSMHDLDVWGSTNSDPLQGPYVTCSGGSGAWAALNGNWHTKRIDDSRISFPALNSSNWGTYPGGISCTTAPPIFDGHVDTVTGVTARVTTSRRTEYGWTSGATHLQDGDPIVFESISKTTQYYAKVSCDGCTSSQFEVYSDTALTKPVSSSMIAPAIGSFVGQAEACPDVATLKLPGPIYFDSGPGSGNVIRCVTVLFAGEPCSEYATGGEQKSYPCPSDPTNINKSSLQNLQPGDSLFDVAHLGGNHERFFVLKKTVQSNGQIALTLMRWYGNDPNWLGSYDQTDAWASVHGPGWQAIAISTIPAAWLDVTDQTNSWIPENPQVAGIHNDIGPAANGQAVIAQGVSFMAPDDLGPASLPQLLATPPTWTHNQVLTWLGDTTNPYFGNQQSYPSHRQATASPDEQMWKSDWGALNPSFGGANGAGSGIGGRSMSKVPGTSNVYQIGLPGGGISLKTTPYLMIAGHQYFHDISGPGSAITDNDLDAFCLAYQAGECRSGSMPGNAYFAARGIFDPGVCVSNNVMLNVPCLIGLQPEGGWAFQMGLGDSNGKSMRRLTMGWQAPMQHFSFMNWMSSPDAKYGFFATIAPQMNVGWTGIQWWAMKLPPWNVFDATDRSTYINVPVVVTGTKPGDQVRIAFGYAENGAATDMFCTSRHERCYSAATSPTTTFQFGSTDSAQYVSCSSGCTVYVPAIPLRTLYYQTEVKGASGSVSQGFPQVVPVYANDSSSTVDMTFTVQAVSVTLNSTPAGASVTVTGTGCKGGTYTTPATLQWTAGSSCGVSVGPATPGGGVRYTAASWSDGVNGMSRTITAPSVAKTYSAKLTTQYLLSVTVSPASAGTVTATPASADGYYDAGTSVQLAVSPANVFAGYTGDVSGVQNPATVVMSAARSVTATFTSNSCAIGLNESTRSVGKGVFAGTIAVTAGPGCAWNVVNNTPQWISITSAFAGTGNGSVSFQVAANASNQRRQASLSVGGQPYTITQAGAAGSSLYDFDGNGTPDLVWQEQGSGRVTIHYYGNASGSTDMGWRWLFPGPIQGWRVVAVADFNGDGVPDLVWQHNDTRQVIVHYYGADGGATDVGYQWLYSGNAAGWRVVAAADFNGDGVPDLVWQNDATRQVTVHYYSGPGGAVDIGWNWLYSGNAAGWHIAAAADFNGDGVPDLIWQNDVTAQVTVHYYGGAGGAADIGWAWLYPNLATGWKVAFAADFDGNGVPDLVWQNLSTGQTTVNYYGGSGGATVQGWQWLYSGNATGWSVVD